MYTLITLWCNNLIVQLYSPSTIIPFVTFHSNMATSFNDDWQAGKKFLECNSYMLDNHLYCDVKFHVGKAGRLISAHTYVLARRSSIFAAMFYGSLPETSDVIVVSDIEPEVFDILLKYIYLFIFIFLKLVSKI